MWVCCVHTRIYTYVVLLLKTSPIEEAEPVWSVGGALLRVTSQGVSLGSFLLAKAG